MKKRKDYLLCSGNGISGISVYGKNNFMSDYDRRQFDVDSGMF